MTLQVRAARRHWGVNSESAGKTAVPFAGKAASTAACSSATAATLLINSWCSRCALLMMAIVACASAANCAVSPG